MIQREPLTLRNLKGSVLIFEDADFMTRACGRLTQVMVFEGRPFTLFEAIGDREVCGATILKDDLSEFARIFNESDYSPEETSMIQEMSDLDFIVAIHRPEMSLGLFMHEFSHVLFHYDFSYREQVTMFWNKLDEATKQEMTERLKRKGYEDKEIVDEWFAHLLFGFRDVKGLVGNDPELVGFLERMEEEFTKLNWN